MNFCFLVCNATVPIVYNVIYLVGKKKKTLRDSSDEYERSSATSSHSCPLLRKRYYLVTNIQCLECLLSQQTNSILFSHQRIYTQTLGSTYKIVLYFPLLSLPRTFGRLVLQDVPTPLATWVSLHDPRRHARSKGATIILSSQGVVLVVK